MYLFSNFFLFFKMLDYIFIVLLKFISLSINKEKDILNNFPIITYISHKFIITCAISLYIMVFLKLIFFNGNF